MPNIREVGGTPPWLTEKQYTDFITRIDAKTIDGYRQSMALDPDAKAWINTKDTAKDLNNDGKSQ